MEAAKQEMQRSKQAEQARARELAKLKETSIKTDQESKKWRDSAMSKTVLCCIPCFTALVSLLLCTGPAQAR
jgi:hypothetical protein